MKKLILIPAFMLSLGAMATEVKPKISLFEKIVAEYNRAITMREKAEEKIKSLDEGWTETVAVLGKFGQDVTKMTLKEFSEHYHKDHPKVTADAVEMHALNAEVPTPETASTNKEL